MSTADQAQLERMKCVHDHGHGVREAELQPCNPLMKAMISGQDFVVGLDIKHAKCRHDGPQLAVVVVNVHILVMKVRVKAGVDEMDGSCWTLTLATIHG